MSYAGTPDAFEEDLRAEILSLFAGDFFWNSRDERVPLKVFVHSLPIREGADDTEDADELPEPYVRVQAASGRISDENGVQEVGAAVVICTCDSRSQRHGHKDTLHIINVIYQRFAKNPVLAGRYALTYPIEWLTSDEDTYPYYYGGLLLNFELPAVRKEDALA